MNQKLRILKAVLLFAFLVGILFGALALLPVLAQGPWHGRAAPDEPFVPKPGGISAQLVASSTTGYIIDDGASGFTSTVAPDGWTPWFAGGYNGDYLYSPADNDGDYAQWTPDLDTKPEVGQYEVSVHYYAFATHYNWAQFTIGHDAGVTVVPVDESVKADGSPPPGDSGWKSLGVYSFTAGTGYVRLTDETPPGHPGAGTFVVADAVKFAPMNVWVDDNYCQTCPNDGYVWGVTAFNDIQAGINAVATNGTVHVGPGTYYQSQYITITKPITLSGAGAASTVISVTSAAVRTAIELLSGGVRISGFDIGCVAGPSYGIVNYDYGASTYALGITDYVIDSNVIHGFAYGGVYIKEGRGQISNNGFYRNAAEAILVEDSYTGTLVSGNTITGSLGAGEAGIYVLNGAGDLTLSSNRVTSCTEGVLILQNATIPFGIQKVALRSNTITGGTRGVHVSWTAGTIPVRQVVIGGSPAYANSIYGNTEYELRLTGYSSNITATYNYWGHCLLREIEDEIYHNPDSGSLGTVTYEPAMCVPASLTLQVAPCPLPANGLAQAVVTATARDAAGGYVLPGTMIGITTTHGSVPYGYAEAEDATAVSTSPPGNWHVASYGDQRASGTSIIYADSAGDSASWTFTGEAVSLIYVTGGSGGSADVSVDGSLVKTINFASATTQFRVEDVITNGLPVGSHTIQVTHNGGGRIWLDAFRSGGVVRSGGRVVTTLTSARYFTDTTATVMGTVYNGRIITSVPPPYPLVTGTAACVFQVANLQIAKSASPTTVNPGQDVVYTISYSNTGSATATNAQVTDTLPSGFLFVSSNPLPSSAVGNKRIWRIGDMPSGMVGSITLVARPDTAVAWPVPTVATNTVEIDSETGESAYGNNTALRAVTVVPAPPTLVTVTAYPTSIPADGASTAVITATVKDANGNPVVDGTAVTFTTNLNTKFQESGSATCPRTTAGGVATATLQAGTTAGTATITAAAGAASGWTQVTLTPLEPWNVAISANPSRIRVSPRGDITSTLYITVTDRYNNLVDGARVSLTTTAGSLVGTGGLTQSVTTTRGVALAGLASSCTVTTATVTAAITTTGRPTATVDVAFIPGLPYTITKEAYPTLIRVCGGEAVVTATVWDECGNRVEDGTEVKFAVEIGHPGEMRPTLTRTVNGVATSTVRTTPYVFGQRYLEVLIFSRRQAPDDISVKQRIDLMEGVPQNINLMPSLPSIEVMRDVLIVAHVRDCAGNNVQDGTLVTFTANSLGVVSPTVVATEGGLADTMFRALCTVGTAVITATTDSKAVSTTVAIEAGPADRIDVRITPDHIRNCGGTAVVEATLYDRCNNLVKDGTLVQFTPMYRYVRTSPVTAVTRRGVVSATVTAMDKPLETWPRAFEQIDVTSGSAMPGFVNLWIEPGVASRVRLTADPGSIPINGDAQGYNITIVARVTDCSDTPVTDTTRVRLQTTLGYFRESGLRSYNPTTVGGLVTATLTSQSVAGEVTVSAATDSITDAIKVRFLPDEPYMIEMSAIPETIEADGRSTSWIVARVKDVFNNPVMDGVTVTFGTQYGYFLETGDSLYTTTTDIDGFAFATLVADVVPRTTMVRCVAYNNRQGYTYVFFITPVPRRYIYLPVIRKLAP